MVGKIKKLFDILWKIVERTFDEISCLIRDLLDKSFNTRKIINSILIRLLTLIPPIFFGVKIEDFIDDIENKTFQFSVNYLKENWILILSLSLFLLGIILKSKTVDRKIYILRTYDAIRWLYHDIGLDSAGLADSEIRCTIWTPQKSDTRIDKMKVIQLTDYFPILQKNYDEKHFTKKYRMNKYNGRIRRVLRKHKKNLEPIGIVGSCIVNSMQSREAIIMTAEVTSGFSTKRYLKEKMNYSESEANRMTQDRKSYCGLTLMNRTKTDVLGVLFFDSSKKNIFSNQFLNRVEKYLPRIAEILVS
ncbi:hypothetical protein KJ742_03660 [Patescibacteria group bacterium]|nr:hypothetical protein [Patescibacteria group bacterium]MBU1683018.1 hypothetical protein [Patescibacteria group bacterium]MBU1935246.1 hypothetical protein [Patescibacteria group bacterium]